jgi:cell division protein FtsL
VTAVETAYLVVLVVTFVALAAVSVYAIARMYSGAR